MEADMETKDMITNDFSEIGFEVESSDDIYRMLEENVHNVRQSIRCGEKRHIVLELDEHSWLFYYGNRDGIDGTDCELFFKNPNILNVKNNGWVTPTEDGYAGMIEVFCDGENATGFPLNVTVPNAYVYSGRELDGRIDIAMTMFAQQLDVYGNMEEYRETCGDGLCLDGCIPYGTFPILNGIDEDSFEPSPEALMSGTVTEAEKLVNAYTGREFWYITFDCAGHSFQIVADTRHVPDGVREGDFVYGSFWISGLIIHGRKGKQYVI